MKVLGLDPWKGSSNDEKATSAHSRPHHRHLENICFAEVGPADMRSYTDEHFIKLFRLTQYVSCREWLDFGLCGSGSRALATLGTYSLAPFPP